MSSLRLLGFISGIFAASVVLVTFPSQSRAADPSLHQSVDRLIESGMGNAQPGARSSDSEFVRRVYLDLAGRIPTREETVRFLIDKSDAKRAALIDHLLSGPDYPRRMQELFHAMLMERRGDEEAWTTFLRTAFTRNTPWDEMARSLLAPDADNEATRGSAYFLTARLVKEGAMAPVDVPGLTRDVGRLLAGVDLACAQCHDHVSIDDYKQIDFQGLHMIFENVQQRRGVTFPAVTEKVMTREKDFMSVFTSVAQKTAPRVPGGGRIEIFKFPKGEEYKVPPDRKTKSPGVLKFSPLRELATHLTAADNKLFSRNIVNRLWFVMMGRGLVEPLDLQHTDNPATHPELLDHLATEFAAHKFDIKWFLKQLAASDCYQRTSLLPESEFPPWQSYAYAHEKRLSAEQILWSTLVATRAFNCLPDGRLTDLDELVQNSKDAAELKTRVLKAFAHPPKNPEDSFRPTVKSALFLMHDEHLLALLKPAAGNLVERLSKLKSDDAVAEELFLSVLNRHPRPEDVADVGRFLGGKPADQRPAAIGRLAWALLASTEFILNH